MAIVTSGVCDSPGASIVTLAAGLPVRKGVDDNAFARQRTRTKQACPWKGSLSLSDMLRVRIGAEQPLHFFGILESYLDHPTLSVRVAIDERRILLERLVGVQDRSADR